MVRANKEHKELVVTILVSAFAPLEEANSINFIVKQDEKRLERMKVLMEYLFDKAIRNGTVFLSDNQASCLLVNFTEQDRFSIKGF